MSPIPSTRTPALGSLSYVVAEANLTDYRDRSAPSDFHWKVLKCRMLIFSETSVLASPDYRDVKQIHVVFRNSPDCYNKLFSLFSKFGLAQKGELKRVTIEVFQSCLQYSITARIAPTWNLVGKSYFVNNRDFLTTSGPQPAVQCSLYVTDEKIDFHLKALKITLMRNHRPIIGDWVRVLPSLNRAIVEDVHEQLPSSVGNFKCYKDLKRHWKNIHGYRLPESECVYYSVRFWRGQPLTYPAVCVLPEWPLVVPVSNKDRNNLRCMSKQWTTIRQCYELYKETIIKKYVQHLQTKMVRIMDEPINFGVISQHAESYGTQTASRTQAVSLCTPTLALAHRTVAPKKTQLPDMTSPPSKRQC